MEHRGWMGPVPPAPFFVLLVSRRVSRRDPPVSRPRPRWCLGLFGLCHSGVAAWWPRLCPGLRRGGVPAGVPAQCPRVTSESFRGNSRSAQLALACHSRAAHLPLPAANLRLMPHSLNLAQSWPEFALFG